MNSVSFSIADFFQHVNSPISIAFNKNLKNEGTGMNLSGNVATLKKHRLETGRQLG
jgi:hypothetical protein